MRICPVLLLLLLGACRSASPPSAPPPAPAATQRSLPAALIAPAAGPDLAACCQQCLDASARDPIGVDLRAVPCSRYQGAVFNSGPGVDPACARLLEAQRRTVGACQNPR